MDVVQLPNSWLEVALEFDPARELKEIN